MTDPRGIINNNNMTGMQILVVALTVGLNALDGFDVLSISFASPGIADEWGIDRAALGIVLSMELIGMAIGSILLGNLADKIGRRPTILVCLVVMATGMFMVTTVHDDNSFSFWKIFNSILNLIGQDRLIANILPSVFDLSIWRILTGLGIGGMLAAINPMAAEFSSDKSRHLAVSLMVIGYPIGGVIGGAVVIPLLAGYDWRSVFYFGAAATVLFIPLVYFFVPESVHWLTRKQPQNALDKVNFVLKKIGHAIIDALPHIDEDTRKKSISDLFAPGLRNITIILTVAYLFHITTFYFIIKWVPKIVADMGFAASNAGLVLTIANLGAVVGGVLFGFMTFRISLKSLTIAILFLSIVMLAIFGQTPQELFWLSTLAAAVNFCTNAGVVGLYALFVQGFPTHVRASGTGFAIGVGRGGAVVSPIIAGYLFNAGFSLGSVATIMGVGAVIAAFTLMFLHVQPDSSES